MNIYNYILTIFRYKLLVKFLDVIGVRQVFTERIMVFRKTPLKGRNELRIEQKEKQTKAVSFKASGYCDGHQHDAVSVITDCVCGRT